MWFLPFWHLFLELEDFPANSRAELRRMLVSWQHVPDAWEQEPVQLMVPAFKLNPGLFLKIAARLSISNMEMPDSSRPLEHKYSLQPVRLQPEEAAQAAKVVLAYLFRRHKKFFPLVPDLKFRIRRIRLVFLPFKIEGREIVQCHTGLAIDKRAWELGGNV